MKRSIALASLIICTVGCQQISDTNVDGSPNTNGFNRVLAGVESYEPIIKGGAGKLDVATGGWASVLTTIAFTLVPTVLAINKTLLAKSRGVAIKEIHESTHSVSAIQQVTSDVARAAVTKVLSKVIKV